VAGRAIAKPATFGRLERKTYVNGTCVSVAEGAAVGRGSFRWHGRFRGRSGWAGVGVPVAGSPGVLLGWPAGRDARKVAGGGRLAGAGWQAALYDTSGQQDGDQEKKNWFHGLAFSLIRLPFCNRSSRSGISCAARRRMSKAASVSRTMRSAETACPAPASSSTLTRLPRQPAGRPGPVGIHRQAFQAAHQQAQELDVRVLFHPHAIIRLSIFILISGPRSLAGSPHASRHPHNPIG